MKLKYLIGGVFSVAMLSLASCGLDYEPFAQYSDLTEKIDGGGHVLAFKDGEAATAYRNSMIGSVRNQEYWYQDMMLYSEVRSDNAYGGTTGGEVVPFETNSVDGGSSVTLRDWNYYMGRIGYANVLIQDIDSVAPDANMSADQQKQYKAEALVFRAMMYFEMVRIWGTAPLRVEVLPDITEDNIDEVYDKYYPPLSDATTIYKQIEKDLTDALPYLLDVNQGDKTQLSKGVAHAMLAKVYAEKPLRDYNKVIEECNTVAALGYKLNDDYRTMWNYDTKTKDCVRNTPESILEGQFSAQSGNWVTWMWGRDLFNWDLMFTWAKWATPSRDLISAFDAEGDTIRKNQTIVYYPCTWSNYYPREHYPFMFKCRSAVNSIIRLRYADIFLLKAEALIQTGDLEGGAAIIDQVRARVGLAKLPASVRGNKDNMINALLKERRLELAYEGQRWFDLVRLDKVEEVMNGINSRDEGRLGQRYAFTPDMAVYPIPQTLLDNNDKWVQNPGY